MTDKEALALVWRAQTGDEDAHRAVALHVYTKYQARVRKISADDPAVSLEDIQATFFEGVMRAVMIADHRGDPLYHIGQRGIWNVKSELRAVHRAWKARATVATRTFEDGGHEDPVERLADMDAERAFERADDRMDALDRVHVITTAPLRRHERRAVDVIVSGAAGDPDETGFNKRLAARMGVSQQRASQIMQGIRARVEG